MFLRLDKSVEPFIWMLKLLAKKARPPFLLSIFEQILLATSPLILAYTIGKLINVISMQHLNWIHIIPWFFLLLFAYLIQQSFILHSFKNYLYQKYLEAAIDYPYLKKVSSMPLEHFEDHEFHDLISRTINPSNRIQYITEDFLIGLGSLLKIIILSIFISLTVWWLGPILIALSLFLSKYDSSIGSEFRKFERDIHVHEREKNYVGMLLTNREQMKELKIFKLTPFLMQRWEYWFMYVHKARIMHGLKMLIPILVINLPRVVAFIVSFLVLAWQLSKVGSDVGTFTTIVIVLITLFNSITDFGEHIREMSEGNKYLEEVLQILKLPNHESSNSYLILPDEFNPGNIEFKNVSFTYPNQKVEVLKNVSFTINSGEKVAIVGKNGSGKSTLIKLLLGLYTPTSGDILIDGINLKKINPADRVKYMSAVFQDYGKYALTVRENVGLGNIDNIDDTEAINKAIYEGGAFKFVETLSNKLETPLGKIIPGGHEPSGGEWQRIAISRGLINDSQVLVFDEPTSAIDPISEVILYEKIMKIVSNKTSVLVTHRLGSVKACDRIVVLEKGELIEEGTHLSLLNTDTAYSKMFKAQADWYK